MKVYYDKATGNVVQLTPEQIGRGVVETTEDQDFTSYKQLAERVRETVGVVKLAFGQYRREFAECESYRINPETQELEFTYRDTETNILAGRVDAVEAGNAETAQQLADALTRLNETDALLMDTQAALTESYEELQATKVELKEAKQEAIDAQLGLAELYELVMAGQQPTDKAPVEQPAEGGEVDNG
ncbi:hypothetical protein [Paenibacillus sp. PK3_47]|uniref:hypothetical protein n=1 Tax=Paenibacillus sp. PK3_47 TaxID=2072642 RepID=UPI00201DC2B2|nr:hypothetical protein [Paenibacillus sp. PK3_47]